MPERAFLYTRVSTVDQYRSRLSIEEHQRRGMDYARMEGLDLGSVAGRTIVRKEKEGLQEHSVSLPERVLEEAHSAWKARFAERPVGKWVDAHLRKGDHIIITKLDRAFRNCLDCLTQVEAWKKRGVIVHIIDIGGRVDSMLGKTMLVLFSLMAEWESFRNSERQHDQYRARRRRGGAALKSHIPLGWTLRGEKAIPAAEHQRQMQLIWHLWVDDGMHSKEICRVLNKRKEWRRLKNGKVDVEHNLWHQVIVENFLRAEAQVRYYMADGLERDAANKAFMEAYRFDRLPSWEDVIAKLPMLDNTKESV